MEGRARKGHYQSQMVVAGVEKTVTRPGRSWELGKLAAGTGAASGVTQFSV